MGWKYKTEAERIAAEKAYQAAYRALRKSGKWVRKTNIHSPRIAAKYGLTIGPTQPVDSRAAAATAEPPKPTVRVVTPEERKAREKEKQRKYWHDHYSAVIRERRLAAMTPEQRAARDRRLAAQEGRTLPGVIREVIMRLALECGVSADVMTEKLLMVGGVDFLMRGIEPRMEKRTYNRDVLIRTALEGARFVLDRDHAVIAWMRQPRLQSNKENLV